MSKILIVDDQLGVRRMLFETFSEEHYEVEMAENGVEALRLFIEFKPNLILLDLKMPLMNGIETLRQIRASDSRVAVIMMTGYGETQNMEEDQADLGILYYMNKPFDLLELRERVREILYTDNSSVG